ncbi:hypothetical protein ACX80S_07680 [Arthrobacter sp. RHLT1-20]
MPATNPRVGAYIDALPQWQQAICREVLRLVHAVDPEVEETIKRTTQPCFVLADGGIVPDPDAIITAGHGNTTARMVAFQQGEAVTAPAADAGSKRGAGTAVTAVRTVCFTGDMESPDYADALAPSIRRGAPG